MLVGRQDVFYKWFMDELPDGVELAVRGIPARWNNDHFVLIESGQKVIYGEYNLRHITVNGIDVRDFHAQNGTCREIPDFVAKPPASQPA